MILVKDLCIPSEFLMLVQYYYFYSIAIQFQTIQNKETKQNCVLTLLFFVYYMLFQNNRNLPYQFLNHSFQNRIMPIYLRYLNLLVQNLILKVSFEVLFL